MMKSYDNTDRLDDLIEQIDQTNVSKQKRSVLLSLLIFGVIAFVVYLFFDGDNNQQTATNIQKVPEAKAQIISSSTPLENFNSKVSNNSDNDDSQKTPAVFLGNPKGVTEYIKEQILYPENAFANEIEGEVLVQITINEKGSVQNPTIVKGLGYGCDEEVIRVVSAMPDWKPAQANQKNVEKSYILTVTFSLS